MSNRQQSKRGELLVAILNNTADFLLLKEQGWYRIPKASAPRRWPPQWMAFYQTKVFKNEAYTIHYYGRVREIRIATRTQLFPNELPNAKSDRVYYQVFLHNLERRTPPIISRRLRRIVFIPTTWAKFQLATEINDLFDDSPLEDAVWEALKQQQLMAERQHEVTVGKARYLLDFALYCAKGKIDIETDGDTWHADKARIPEDNKRNNALEAQGWHVLRFNGQQIRESIADYCVPKILDTVNQLGGLSDDDVLPRTYFATSEGIVQQLGLFDNRAYYAPDEAKEE